MANLETLVEILSDSDVSDALESVRSDIECAESAETASDFKSNIDEAIISAEKLIACLRAVALGAAEA